jgi:hypothetical protein
VHSGMCADVFCAFWGGDWYLKCVSFTRRVVVIAVTIVVDLCMSHKYVGTKGPKYSVRPPTSSASLLAFAPPGGSYVRPLPPVGKIPPSDSPSTRCSVSDPLIPAGNGIGPFTMNDGVSATITATTGMGSSTPSTVTTSTMSGFVPPQLPPTMLADVSAMEFPRKNLRFIEMLGEGQFGEVSTCRKFEQNENNYCGNDNCEQSVGNYRTMMKVGYYPETLQCFDNRTRSRVHSRE